MIQVLIDALGALEAPFPSILNALFVTRIDLDLAVLASGNGFQAKACFFAAQAAEKTLVPAYGCAAPRDHG